VVARSAPPPSSSERQDERGAAEPPGTLGRRENGPPENAATSERASRAYSDGVKLFVAGRLGGARQKFRESLRLWPGYALPHRGLGLLHEREGDRVRAVREFEKYLRLAPRANDAAKIKERIRRLGG
jgi:hypothetical protein